MIHVLGDIILEKQKIPPKLAMAGHTYNPITPDIQEDKEFKASFNYTVSLKSVYATRGSAPLFPQKTIRTDKQFSNIY